MNNTAKKSVKKTPSISKRKLVAYGLGIGGCGAMLAGSAEAVLVDVTMPFGTVLDQTSGGLTGANSYGLILNAAGTASAGFGQIDFAGTGGPNGQISLNGAGFGTAGYYAASGFYSLPPSIPYYTRVPHVFSDATSHTFGDGSNTPDLIPNQNNKANFLGKYMVGGEIASTTGVLGFKTADEYWGYLEFSWDDAANALTVLSAKIEDSVVGGVPQPAVYSVSAVPEANPATLMALFSLGAVGLRRSRKRKAA